MNPVRPVTSLSLLAALPLSLAAVACAPEPSDEYRKAIPTEKTVAVEVPQQAGGQAVTQSGGVEQRGQALLGETSEFYRMTRDVSKNVNGGVLFVLGLVRAVVSYPPTDITNGTATWGPWTEALSPNTWKVTVTKLGATEYRYAFLGRAKTAPDSAFIEVLTGTHHPVLDGDNQPIENFGEGSFTLNFDNAQTLPEHEDDVGVATITYSRRTTSVQAHIAAKFDNVKDDDKPGQRIDVDYLYVQNPGGSGELEFTAQGSDDVDPATVDGPGKLTVRSRWTATGAGRSDVKGTGGDLPAGTEATANECWNDNFASVYLHASWDPALAWGAEGGCLIAGASYSTLML